MSNTQILFQFIGWGFLLFLSNRTIRRTELSRLKDQLVVQIEELSKWLELELISEEHSARSLERAYTGKVSRIDLLLQQLNSLSKRKLLNEDLLFEFWDTDVDSIFLTKKLNGLKLIQQDAVETIESSYHSTLFKQNFIRMIYLHYKPELLGTVSSLAILYLLHGIVSILFT